EVASGQFPAGNNHWPVSFANGAAATHKCVIRLDIGVGVEAYSRNIVKGFSLGAAVEGFNVAEGMGEAVARNTNLVRGQAVKHERVVGVGTVSDGDFADAGCCGCRLRLLNTHG